MKIGPKRKLDEIGGEDEIEVCSCCARELYKSEL